MIRKLIVPAALLALAACSGSPTEPAARAGALRANPAFGSGVGLLPPTDESADQPGSGAVASTGLFGSGSAVEPADGIGGYVGSDGRTATGGVTLESAPYLGSGNVMADGPAMGSGTLPDTTQETSDSPMLGGGGTRTDGPQIGSGAQADGGYGMGSGN